MRYGPLLWKEAKQTDDWKALPGRARCTFITMCGYADEQNTCYPSVGALVDDTGMSRTTLHRALNDLKKQGLIIPVGSVRSSNISDVTKWKLQLPQGHQLEEEEATEQQCHSDTGVCHSDTGRTTKISNTSSGSGEPNSFNISKYLNFHLSEVCLENPINGTSRRKLLNELDDINKMRALCHHYLSLELSPRYEAHAWLLRIVNILNYTPQRSLDDKIADWTSYFKLVRDSVEEGGANVNNQYTNIIRNSIGQPFLDELERLLKEA